MSHSIVVTPSVAASSYWRERRPACELFYKPDHPRAIDRYIDFFGEGGRHAEEIAGDRTADA